MPAKDLYELCEICGGSGSLPPDTRMCIDPPIAARRVLRRTDDGKNFVCPSCAGRRFVVTGLTVGQVAKIIRERDELAEELSRLKAERLS
jgi:hypothetical protein